MSFLERVKTTIHRSRDFFDVTQTGGGFASEERALRDAEPLKMGAPTDYGASPRAGNARLCCCVEALWNIK